MFVVEFVGDGAHTDIGPFGFCECGPGSFQNAGVSGFVSLRSRAFIILDECSLHFLTQRDVVNET